jgi:hypothetical protein
VSERGLGLSDRLHAPLIWVKDDEKLFGPWLAEQQFHVRTHPANLRAHRFEQGQREMLAPTGLPSLLPLLNSDMEQSDDA